MKTQVSDGLGGGGEQPPSLAEGVDLMARVAAAVASRETAVRELVAALADLNRAGVVEPLEGLPIDVWLAVTHGMNAAERAMLLDAGDILAGMPALQQWWARGIVSWSVVRDVVGQVRQLGRDGRATVDARLAASEELLADLDPDQIAWAVADAVEAVRGSEAKEKAEAREERDSFLSFQMDLWGGSRVYGHLDPIGTAVVTGVLDELTAKADAAGRDDADAGAEATGTSDDAAAHDSGPHATPVGRWTAGRRRGRRTRAKDRAQALIDLCSRRHGPHGTRRRPLVIIHVPIDRIEATGTGLLEVAVPGALPRLSAALVDNLCRDADVKAVVFDGARPLCVTRKTRAADLPEDTRIAVGARDMGARDPAGRTPIPLSHVHHVEPGHHHPDRLITLSPRGHLRILHRHGWTPDLDPDDGTVTWTRNTGTGQTIRTRPWGTRLNPAEPPPDPPVEPPDRPGRERR